MPVFPRTNESNFYIGLMSGTSLDGVDGVLACFPKGNAAGEAMRIQVLGHASRSFPEHLREELMALNTAGANELHRSALAGNALSRLYAEVVHELLVISQLSALQVRAIGAHGQTVRHQPLLDDGVGYTLQIQNPALLAEQTGIAVVADLRSRDIAAGGQGAPLVPAFHQHLFAQPDEDMLVLNIGGIANLSCLPNQADESSMPSIIGFDCGPGNVLLDWWCQRHQNLPYDDEGRWAASGKVIPSLLKLLCSEPFLALPPPKSTGRDLFNPVWLTKLLADFAGQLSPEDIQATLTAFTAQCCADAVTSQYSGSQHLLVCGGGALNHELMRQLQALLPDLKVQSTNAWGMPPLQVEAAAFAWLAQQCIEGLPGNLPSVTGARGPRMLGAIYPA